MAIGRSGARLHPPPSTILPAAPSISPTRMGYPLFGDPLLYGEVQRSGVPPFWWRVRLYGAVPQSGDRRPSGAAVSLAPRARCGAVQPFGVVRLFGDRQPFGVRAGN